jgi:hypothetical protein
VLVAVEALGLLAAMVLVLALLQAQLVAMVALGIHLQLQVHLQCMQAGAVVEVLLVAQEAAVVLALVEHHL